MPLTLDQWRRAIEAPPGELPADVAAARDACFEVYLRTANRHGMTLDKVFGACGPSGCDPWWIKLALDRRDEFLREGGDVVCAGGSISRKADAVRRAISVYRPTWNRRDHFLGVGANERVEDAVVVRSIPRISDRRKRFAG